METYLFWLVPAASLLALALAGYFYRQMKQESEGTPTMARIASYVRKGAMSYLKQQYKIVTLVFIGLAQLAKPLGTRGIPHRRFLLRSVGVFRYENCYVCLRTYGKCRT